MQMKTMLKRCFITYEDYVMNVTGSGIQYKLYIMYLWPIFVILTGTDMHKKKKNTLCVTTFVDMLLILVSTCWFHFTYHLSCKIFVPGSATMSLLIWWLDIEKSTTKLDINHKISERMDFSKPHQISICHYLCSILTCHSQRKMACNDAPYLSCSIRLSPSLTKHTPPSPNIILDLIKTDTCDTSNMSPPTAPA